MTPTNPKYLGLQTLYLEQRMRRHRLRQVKYRPLPAEARCEPQILPQGLRLTVNQGQNRQDRAEALGGPTIDQATTYTAIRAELLRR